MKIFKLFIISIALVCASYAFAQGATTTQEYQLLSGIPGLESLNTSTGDFSSFINAIYRMSIGIGAALAVIMIIFTGIQYSMSAVGGKKAEYKDKITMALGGLGLLLGAFVFLEFINPGLTQLDNKGGNLSNIEFSELDFEPISAVEVAEVNPVDVSLETNVWVPVDGAPGSYSTEQECIKASDPRNITPCRYIPNRNLTSISAPPLVSGGDGELTLAAGDPAMSKKLTAINIERTAALRGWSPNPYRAPEEFIDCKGTNENTGTKSVKVTKKALEGDAYINYNLQKLGLKYPIPINSAFRSDPTCKTTGTRANHPHGGSFDYSIAGYTSAQKKTLQELAIRSGALRLGFGASFFHVQWDDRSSGANKYWCYKNKKGGLTNPGPYSGVSLPGPWSTGSCKY